VALLDLSNRTTALALLIVFTESFIIGINVNFEILWSKILVLTKDLKQHLSRATLTPADTTGLLKLQVDQLLQVLVSYAVKNEHL